MADPTASLAPPAARWFNGWGAALVLVALHVALAWHSTRRQTVTFDEPASAAGGVAAWQAGRHDLTPEVGRLTQAWLAFPVLAAGHRLPADIVAASPDPLLAFAAGNRLFYGTPGAENAVLASVRPAMLGLDALLGLAIYAWSRRIFGPGGAILSAALFAFCPNFLAHGPRATADVAATLAFLVATWALWSALHRATVGTVLRAGFAAAALCLVKNSAVLLAPIAVLQLAWLTCRAAPLEIGWWRVAGIARSPRAARLGVVLAAVAIVYGAIWAAYGFRFAALPRPDAAGLTMPRWEEDVFQQPDAAGRILRWSATHRVLPEAFLYGFGYVVRHAEIRVGFLDGEFGLEGWRSFFPRAFLLKTPLAALALLALAAAAVWRRRPGSPEPGGRLARFDAAVPVWAWLAVYASAAIASHLNIGLRHFLPAVAALYVLAGAAGRWWTAGGNLGRIALSALLALLAQETLLNHPHHLAFFNRAAGGPANGYRHLVDSSLDWGQDLPELRRWLDAGAPAGDGPARSPAYVSYFGSANLAYHGFRERVLPGYSPWDQSTPDRDAPFAPGLYCMSATLLQGVYWSQAPGPNWSAGNERRYQQLAAAFAGPAPGPTTAERAEFRQLRMSRLSQLLRHLTPVHTVNHTIFVWRLGPAEIALFERAWGAPAG